MLIALWDFMLTRHKAAMVDRVVVFECGIEEFGQTVVCASLQLRLMLFGSIKQLLINMN